MRTLYKSAEERKIAVPISISVKLITDLEVVAAKLDKNRSEIINSLIRYFINHLKDKPFIEEVTQHQ